MYSWYIHIYINVYIIYIYIYLFMYIRSIHIYTLCVYIYICMHKYICNRAHPIDIARYFVLAFFASQGELALGDVETLVVSCNKAGIGEGAWDSPDGCVWNGVYPHTGKKTSREWWFIKFITWFCLLLVFPWVSWQRQMGSPGWHGPVASGRTEGSLWAIQICRGVECKMGKICQGNLGRLPTKIGRYIHNVYIICIYMYIYIHMYIIYINIYYNMISYDMIYIYIYSRQKTPFFLRLLLVVMVFCWTIFEE